MNKYIQITLWIASIIVIAVLLGFAKKSNNNNELKANNILVNIDYDANNEFVTEYGVKKLFLNTQDSSKLLLENIKPYHIEKIVVNHPSIKNAQVYKTINGKLIVNVIQRKPIVRIFTKNSNYYIDEEGGLMPFSNQYTPHVLIVTGRVNEPFSKRYKYNYKNLTDSIKPKTYLDDIYQMAVFIQKSDFWKAQIEQIHVNKDLDMVLIPKVGNHKIVFGGVDNLEKKFNKLMVFYKKGLSKTGWNEFSIVNLKYKNQVVCTKSYYN